MSKKKSLREHLKQSRQTVAGWPEWKQRALGGESNSNDRTGGTGTIKPATAGDKSKHNS